MKNLILSLVMILFALLLNAEFEMGVAVKLDSTRAFSYQIPYQTALKEMKPIMRKAALEHEMAKAGGLESIVKSLQYEPDGGFNAARADSLFMISSAAGYLISEQVLSDTKQALKGKNYRLKMEYQARVLPFAKAIPSTINAKITLEPVKPKTGEAFSLSITPDQDVWLFVFEFNDTGKFRLLYPKDADRNMVKKNAVSNHRINASMPQGKTTSYQSLLVIASKEELNGWRSFIKHTDDPDGWMDQGQSCFGLFEGWLSTYNPETRLERFIQLELKQ